MYWKVLTDRPFFTVDIAGIQRVFPTWRVQLARCGACQAPLRTVYPPDWDSGGPQLCAECDVMMPYYGQELRATC